MASTGTWQKVEAVFAEALEHPHAERATLATMRCAGDAQALAEVLRLLDARQRMGDFLQPSLPSPADVDG